MLVVHWGTPGPLEKCRFTGNLAVVISGRVSKKIFWVVSFQPVGAARQPQVLTPGKERQIRCGFATPSLRETVLAVGWAVSADQTLLVTALGAAGQGRADLDVKTGRVTEYTESLMR